MSNRRDFAIQSPEIQVYTVMSQYTDTTTVYPVNIPLGCYWLQLHVTIVGLDGDVGGSLAVAPYLDAAQTVVGDAFSMRAINSAAYATALTIDPGSTTTIATANLCIALGKQMPIPLPFGVRVRWLNSDSTTATSMNVKLVAVRDA